MTETRWTIGELAKSAAEVLAKRGFESPRLEADLLLASVLGMDRLALFAQFDMPVDDVQRSQFRQLIKRRLTHEPIAYILGEREFLDLTFQVGPGVLIPRPETELVVAAAATFLAEVESPRILEVGIGSGCIALSLLHQHPKATALGLDISPRALAFTEKNAKRHGLSDRLELLESDLFSNLSSKPAWQSDIDLIVSNPPYIRLDEESELAPDVREFEPAEALFCPEDGLSFHRRIIDQGAALLTPKGGLVLELAAGTGKTLVEYAEGRLPQWQAKYLPDYSALDRVFCLTHRQWPRKFSSLHGAPMTSDIKED